MAYLLWASTTSVAYRCFSTCSRLSVRARVADELRHPDISISRLCLVFSLTRRRSSCVCTAACTLPQFLLRISRSRTKSSIALRSSSRFFRSASISGSCAAIRTLSSSRWSSAMARLASTAATLSSTACRSLSCRETSFLTLSISASACLSSAARCTFSACRDALSLVRSSSSAVSFCTLSESVSASLRDRSVLCLFSRSDNSSCRSSSLPSATLACLARICRSRSSTEPLTSFKLLSSRSFRLRSRSTSVFLEPMTDLSSEMATSAVTFSSSKPRTRSVSSRISVRAVVHWCCISSVSRPISSRIAVISRSFFSAATDE
mmetsp:Transcript_33671/g.108759  ORF Transcript_33671/g.108759 Transcript_33671/m.108759 type:complete len:320 (-) Transcript_33671:438-1397(-)